MNVWSESAWRYDTRDSGGKNGIYARVLGHPSPKPGQDWHSDHQL